jgi:hypothetical protein
MPTGAGHPRLLDGGGVPGSNALRFEYPGNDRSFSRPILASRVAEEQGYQRFMTSARHSIAKQSTGYEAPIFLGVIAIVLLIGQIAFPSLRSHSSASSDPKTPAITENFTAEIEPYGGTK